MLLLIGALAIAGATSPARSATLEPGHDVARHALIESGVAQPAPTALDSVPHPWPGIALLLSATGAALPIVVAGAAGASHSDASLAMAILAAEIVTPSAGHLYAGLFPRAGIGIVTRTVGWGAMAIGGASEGVWGGETSSDFGGGAFLMLLGATVMVSSALVDVITVPGDVDRKNAEWLRQHASVGLRIAPDATPELAFTARF